MRNRFIPIVAAAGLLITSLAFAGVEEHRLANGMRVLVKADHRAPVVVSQVWYRVGSSYEHTGITGISHVLEHMMFKGTMKHPAGEFSRIIAANGGSENAFTGRDYTAYFQQLEKSRLPIALELEADRMRNLLLREEDFAKEVQVVMEERRLRTEDKPPALTYEQFAATAYQANTYHHPVIGWMDDLKHLNVEQLRDWYRQWYAPNNATLVVVGDVKPETVFELAEQYFGPLKPSEITLPRPLLDPPQRGERRVTVRAPAELPLLMLGYQTPSLATAEGRSDAYALEVLAHILDLGDSARLTRELVRGATLASSAGAGYDLNARLDALFTLEGVPARGIEVEQLESALRTQVARLRDELVTDEELKRVKAQVKAAKIFELDSVFYQAMQIGTLETVGLGWAEADRYVEAIDAITPKQLQSVARRYLTDDRLTVAVLEPKTIGEEGGKAL